MTAPTHLAAACFVAAAADAGFYNLALCAAGGLLPDIDHPQSTVGWMFPFLSYPIQQTYGHRTVTHSFTIWFPFALIGILLHTHSAVWVAYGAMSHIVADAFNESGVQAFWPLDIIMVASKRRIRTGSWAEVPICLVLIALTTILGYSYTVLGSPRRLINLVANAPKIAAEEFIRTPEDTVCFINGDFRKADGEIKAVRWLVVGTGKADIFYYYDPTGKKMMETPRMGKFIYAKLETSKAKWTISTEPLKQEPCFFYLGRRWYFLDNKDLIPSSMVRKYKSPGAGP